MTPAPFIPSKCYSSNFFLVKLISKALTPKLQHLIKDAGYSKDDIFNGFSKDHGSYAWPSALNRLYYWTTDYNSTFAISSNFPPNSLSSTQHHKSSVVRLVTRVLDSSYGYG